MSIPCKVQERPTQLMGYVKKIHGSEDDFRIVHFVFIDIDDSMDSMMQGTVILEPGWSSKTFELNKLKEWTVILKAQSNPFGDEAICATHLKIGEMLHKLSA